MKCKKLVSGLLVGAMLAGTLTGCGSKASSDTSFTMWIYQGEDASYYTDYADNPALKYAANMEWGEDKKNIDLEFWVPASGTANDSFNTMIGSGDYPDILDGTLADTPANLYNQGVILDLTDLVNENMPNYKKLVESNEEFKQYAVTKVDGEDKYLSIMGFNDDYAYSYHGYMYRRDWIVKYGTNPTTGAKFTGGYTDTKDPDSWKDDVVFPSGGTDPVYISDWEWMFGIFEKAYADLGLTDSYCVSMYYPGFTWAGDLCSSFGGGCVCFYEDANGDIQFGGDKDSTRAYFECLNNWYDKGWLDPSFNERTSDMFYSMDDTTVRQGKIGMWDGLQSELGGRLNNGDELLEGIYTAGCSLPINDIYGTDACKNVEPDTLLTAPKLEGTRYYITSAAEGKDLATLCQFVDYFYSEEGSVLKTLGMNADQVKESGDDLYEKWGIEDGAYTEKDGKYTKAKTVQEDSGNLGSACVITRFPGLTRVAGVDLGYADTYAHSMDTWIQYKNYGSFLGTPLTDAMTEDEADTCNDIRTKALDYMQTNAVKFIKGEKDINKDSDWEEWCKMLKKYNVQKANKIYQSYADTYGTRGK